MRPTGPAMQPEVRSLADLRAAPHNSRVHTEAQVAQIAASMQEFGWTIPVLVDEDGNVIAGHARILAGQSLGYTEAPVLVAEGWTEEQKRAYLIADNKLTENSTWDMEVLGEEIRMLSAADFDLPVLGFEPFQIEAMLSGADEALFDVKLPGEGDTGGGNAMASDYKVTQDGMAQFALVVTTDTKAKAFAVLRRYVKSGQANNYSDAFTLLIEDLHGSHSSEA